MNRQKLNSMRTRPTLCRRYIGLALLLGAMVALGAASMAASQGGHDNEGFLYGTVTTTSGKAYTGTLRWDDEEAFWDDLFNSAKEDLPFLERWGDKSEEDGRVIKVLGRSLRIRWGHDGGRHFVARFGDIDWIEALGSDEARLHMRDGSSVHVEGSANDVDADVVVDDASLGTVEVPWRRISKIEFAATPASVEPRGFRLHGQVESTEQTFHGFVQWDSEECLSYDELDGDDDDVSLSIKMGTIRSIERINRRSSRVTLKDGRVLELDGSNDVDDDIRGVLVEDPRFGRVELSWDAFRKVTFDDAGPSGSSYANFANTGGELRATVTGADNASHSGRLVFDLDETYRWEMLDGDDDDVSYSIPFHLIRRIEPLGRSASTVALKSGETLRLEDSQDVTDANDGVVVIPDTGDPVYLEWVEIDAIDFE